MGAKVYENTEVVKLIYHDDYIDVITEFGYKVKAKKVIVATGYNTKLFTDRKFATKTTTFNIVTKPVSNFTGWEGNTLIRDNSDPYNYLRTTKDNRIIIGGEDIDIIEGIDESLAKQKYDILECRLKSMFKDIKDIEIEFKYCGVFASTPDNLGFVGPDDKNNKNLWYLLGYRANGILFAILGAMMLTELYDGKFNKDMNLFKVDRFDN